MRVGLGNKLTPVLLILLSVWGSLATDEYVVKNWTTADGLPDSIVRAIAETPDGYLWVATDGGVARFDGNRFEPFTVQTTPELGANVVWDMLVDQQGGLWIATQRGLSRYQDGKFEFIPLASDVVLGPVWRISESTDGDLWFLGDDGLRRYLDGKIVKVPLHSDSSSGRVQEMAAGLNGEMWFGMRDGLWKYENGQFTHVAGTNRIDSVAVDLEGKVWMVERHRRLLFYSDGEVTHVPVPGDTRLHMMRALPNGEVWVGAFTDTRAFRVRGQEVREFNEGDGMHGSRPICFFYGNDGAVWMGVNRGGLFRFRSRRIEVFHRQEGLATGFSCSIAEDKSGRVYVSMMGGGLLQFRGDRFERLELEADVFPRGALTSVLGASEGGVWLGNLGDRLHRLVGGRDVESKGAEGGTRSLLIDSSNQLWRGTSRIGLEHFSGSDVIRYDAEDGMTGNRVLTLAEDSSGAIWAGTDKGLNRVFNGQVTSYLKADGLTSETIKCLFVDSTGQLWIGTEGGGLLAYDGTRFFAFGTRQGLPDTSVTQIVEDDLGNLWLGTKVGLYRIALTELHAVISGESEQLHGTLIGRDEGLIGPQFGSAFQPSYLRSSDGLLWFCGNNGVVRVDPAKFVGQGRPPKVYVEEVLLDGIGEPVLQHGPKTVRIPSGVERVGFRFTAISFSAPDQLRFRYRLRGYDDWNTAGTERSASYSRVPPGRYDFQVMAANSEGIWNEVGASIELQFDPAFWQTFWFRALSGLVILGGLVGLIRAIFLRRIRRQLSDARQRQALETERARISRDMHDELGANLTRIKLLSERIEQESGGVSNATENAQRISKTARDLALGMDEIVWAINPEKDRVESFTYYLASTAEESLRETSMRLRIDIPDDLPDLKLSANLRHNLVLAAKEAIHNSVKHSEGSEITLSLIVDGRLIEVTIADNGVGLHENESAREGNGLRNMKARLESVGGECIVETEGREGVRVVLRVVMK